MAFMKNLQTRSGIGWLLQTTARKSMRSLAAAGLSILALSSASAGQAQEHSWDNFRALEVGTKIQVVDQHLKSLDGTFLSVSEDALIYQVDDRPITIPKQNVLRVSSREHLGRGKKALLGYVIGLLVGGAVVEATDKPNEEAGLYALMGAGMGAALPSGHPTIYRPDRHPLPAAPLP